MRLLLDTHVFIWWTAAEPRLGFAARELVTDPDNVVFVSAATAWEVAIKRAKGTLDAPADVRPAIAASGFVELPIELGHAAVAGSLPAHHRDPFARMLVAQAQLEDLALVTADPVLARYDVALVPAGS